MASKYCGCFSCKKTFRSRKVTYIDQNEGTAFCPLCGIDSLIGDASGISLTKEFLAAMHDTWFGWSGEEPDPNDPIVLALTEALAGIRNDPS